MFAFVDDPLGITRALSAVAGAVQPVGAVSVPSATLANRGPKGTKIPRFGLAVASKTGSNGVVVTDLDANGPAADYGFEVGDVILELAAKKVSNVGGIRDAIRAAEKSGRRRMLMGVKSGDTSRYVTRPVARG